MGVLNLDVVVQRLAKFSFSGCTRDLILVRCGAWHEGVFVARSLECKGVVAVAGVMGQWWWSGSRICPCHMVGSSNRPHLGFSHDFVLGHGMPRIGSLESLSAPF